MIIADGGELSLIIRRLVFSFYLRLFSINSCQYGFDELKSDYVTVARKKSPLDKYLIDQHCGENIVFYGDKWLKTPLIPDPLTCLDPLIPELELSELCRNIRTNLKKNVVILFDDNNISKALTCAILLCRYHQMIIMPAAIVGSDKIIRMGESVPKVESALMFAGIPLCPPFASQKNFRKAELEQAIEFLSDQIENVEEVAQKYV
ncbi:MAG: hypothetical protein HQM10_20725 [Candidatus Riflebacteria bacterium]|nr:hypothetical protein [Candidatus Riflebacteria bacterium]